MYGVILAGGGGTRLWPQSRASLPKPLMPLLHDGATMLQATFKRLVPLIPPERLFVSTGSAYAAAVREQLPDLPADHLIIEPSGRDTAPAVGLAAVHVARLAPDGVMGIFPADHIIQDEEGFRHNLRLAERVAGHGYLVTLGMRPTHAETGYGYIEVGAPVPELDGDTHALTVARFVEKPDRARAEQYVAGGRHLWNGGIFIWRVDVILDQFRRQLPEAARRLDAIAAASPAEADAVLQREWTGMPKISVDFGIMEKADRVATIPSTIGWSDAGDWHAVGTLLGSEGAGYVAAEVEHLAVDSQNCVVSAPAGKLVATIGLSDLVIVDTPDALLICPRDRAQEVKRIVDSLRSSERTELL